MAPRTVRSSTKRESKRASSNPTTKLLSARAKHSFRIESFVPAGPTVAMKKSADGDDGIGHTSVVNENDIIAAQRADSTAGGTVAIKLTDLMARPHLDLIVDKFAVKSEDIPDEGLSSGVIHGPLRDGARPRLGLVHPRETSH